MALYPTAYNPDVGPVYGKKRKRKRSTDTDTGVYSSVFPKAGAAGATPRKTWNPKDFQGVATAFMKSPTYSATPQPIQGTGAGYQSDLAKIQARKQAAIRMKRRNTNRTWR